MSIARESADAIITVVAQAGGSISGATLRLMLEDLEPAERTQGIQLLRKEGRLVSTGSTTSIVYHLPGHKPTVELLASKPQIPAASWPTQAISHVNHVAAEPDVNATQGSLSLELQFLACLELLAGDEDFAELGALAKARGAEWLAARLREAA